ncbi:MAG: cupin domain-containing protein [Myxococcota bacterium]
MTARADREWAKVAHLRAVAAALGAALVPALVVVVVIVVVGGAGCGGPPATEPSAPGATGGAGAPVEAGAGAGAETGTSTTSVEVTTGDTSAGQPTVDDLRIAAIEKAVNETAEVRHQCWAFAAANNYHVSGQLRLRLTFEQDARARVEVIADQPRSARLTRCIRELYSAYRWPDGVFEPGLAIELPLDFRRPRFQYTVAAEHVEARTFAGGKVEAKILIDEDNTGNGAAAVSLVTVRGAVQLPAHRHETTSEVWYVLSGQGRVTGWDGVRGAVRIGAGDGVYMAPGVVHGLIHDGDAPLVMVQVHGPSGPQKQWKGQPPVDTVVLSQQELRARPRTFARPRVVRGAEAKVYPIAGGQGQVAIYFDQPSTGERALYMGVLTAQPGLTVPMHRHQTSTELVVPLSGQAVTIVSGDRYPVQPFTGIQLPPGIEHSMETAGDAPLRVLQLYTPSGPEQRFKRPPSRPNTP